MSEEPIDDRGMTRAEAIEPSQPAGGGGAASFPTIGRWPVALQALALIALGFAYRGLFTAPPAVEADAQQQLEYWLFVPTENAPLVVLAIAAWLAYRRWPRPWLHSVDRPTGLGWLIAPSLALGIGVYFWAIYTGTVHLQAFALAFTALGLSGLYWGLPGLRALWLPIVFLLFCVPIPAPLFLALVWKLQLVTAEYTGWLLYLMQEPALVSGDQILRASQGFQVIEGCSGLRSAETLTMLTILLIELFGRRGLHALVLFVCAPLVAFGLNGLRVLTLILNPHSELLGVHTLQGIGILLAGLLVIYAIDGLLAHYLDRHVGGPASGPSSAAPRDPSAAASVERTLSEPRTQPRLPAGLLVTVALVTLVVSLWGPTWQPPDPPRVLRTEVTEALGAWESSASETDWMFLGSASFGEVVHRRYRVRGEEVEVFIGTANLRPGGGSPLAPATERPGTGWAVLEGAAKAVSPDERIVTAQVLKKGGKRVLGYHWSAGALGLSRETFRALLGLDHSPFRRSSGLYAARISTPIVDRPPDTPARARARAEMRLSLVYGQLEPTLRAIEAGIPSS
jgi:exosortase